MSRVAALWVPLFPLAARLRSEPELAGAAVAVCEGNGPAARVVAASRPARKAGVRPGTSLAQARAVLPELIARGRDPAGEASAREALLEVAGSLSPVVEDAGEGLALADVEGMGALFPGPDGEDRLGHAAIRAAEGLGLPVRVGIAGNRLAATLAARRPASPTVVPPGGEREFLAPLPLAELDPPSALAATLERWGLATLGDLASLPPGEVRRRLGPEGEAAWRAARGEDPRPLVPHRPPPVLVEGMELEWPLASLEPLLLVLEELLERLAGRLLARGAACAALEAELTLEPEGHDRRELRLPAPTTEVPALLGLLRLELEGRPPAAPVAAVRCLSRPDSPRRAQLTLFGAPELSPAALAAVLARAAALLGPDRVGSPRPADRHLPGAVETVPFDPPPPPRSRPEPRAGRGLLAVRALRPPVPLEAILEEPGPGGTGTPVLRSLRSPPGAALHVQGLVRVAAGPWRCEEGWWSEAPVERDYWDVELSDGRIYRVFRDGRDGSWWADGVYD